MRTDTSSSFLGIIIIILHHFQWNEIFKKSECDDRIHYFQISLNTSLERRKVEKESQLLLTIGTTCISLRRNPSKIQCGDAAHLPPIPITVGPESLQRMDTSSSFRMSIIIHLRLFHEKVPILKRQRKSSKSLKTE